MRVTICLYAVKQQHDHSWYPNWAGTSDFPIVGDKDDKVPYQNYKKFGFGLIALQGIPAVIYDIEIPLSMVAIHAKLFIVLSFYLILSIVHFGC